MFRHTRWNFPKEYEIWANCDAVPHGLCVYYRHIQIWLVPIMYACTTNAPKYKHVIHLSSNSTCFQYISTCNTFPLSPWHLPPNCGPGLPPYIMQPLTMFMFYWSDNQWYHTPVAVMVHTARWTTGNLKLINVWSMTTWHESIGLIVEFGTTGYPVILVESYIHVRHLFVQTVQMCRTSHRRATEIEH